MLERRLQPPGLLDRWGHLDFAAAWESGILAKPDSVVGSSSSRTVYECSLDLALVVKIAKLDAYTRMRQFLEAWTWMVATEARHILAPCLWISPCGEALVQVRTSPAKATELPAHMPAIYQDVHDGNVGRIGDRVVFHDYNTFAEVAAYDALNPKLAGQPRPPWIIPTYHRWNGDAVEVVNWRYCCKSPLCMEGASA